MKPQRRSLPYFARKDSPWARRLGVSDWLVEEVLERAGEGTVFSGRAGKGRGMAEYEEQTIDYIRQNWERDDRLAVVLIQRTTGQVQQRIRSAEEIADPKYQAHLRAANAQGADVFCSMSSLLPEATGRTKADIGVVRHVFLDLDGGGRRAVDRIVATPGLPPPHHVLHTSRHNHQLIWSVRDFSVPQAEGADARHGGGARGRSGGDRRIASAAPARLPNHKHPEPHYVRDVATVPAGVGFEKGNHATDRLEQRSS